ncbi:MAG: endonuclease/exonuclease/phosphatase family protein [Bacteroidota bacterium]
MNFKNTIALLFVFFCNVAVYSQEKIYKIHTIAFYNCENLFDTIDGENFDEEYLPKKGWTAKKYQQKLNNLGRVLSQIGTNDKQKESPTIIGVCEVENRGVLEDLVKNHQLINKDYGIVHFDSPDRRGIDVGFIYQKKYFRPTSYINVPLLIYKNASQGKKKIQDDEEDEIVIDEKGKRVYTRDILLVTGILEGEEINILVNHWPSRSGGEKKSSPFREAAGRLNKKIMDSIYKVNPKAKIITMGDLNDGSYNRSVKEGIGAKLKKEEVKRFGIYNPFEQMAKDGNATLYFRDAGDIFDQIMVSETLIQKDLFSLHYWKAGIFNKPFLIETVGQYKGYPKRNSLLEPGFSDHFPVYIYLIKEGK